MITVERNIKHGEVLAEVSICGHPDDVFKFYGQYLRNFEIVGSTVRFLPRKQNYWDWDLSLHSITQTDSQIADRSVGELAERLTAAQIETAERLNQTMTGVIRQKKPMPLVFATCDPKTRIYITSMGVIRLDSAILRLAQLHLVVSIRLAVGYKCHPAEPVIVHGLGKWSLPLSEQMSIAATARKHLIEDEWANLQRTIEACATLFRRKERNNK